MDDEEKAKRERARLKFMQDRNAMLQKAQKRLAEAEESDEEEGEQWSTDTTGFRGEACVFSLRILMMLKIHYKRCFMKEMLTSLFDIVCLDQ